MRDASTSTSTSTSKSRQWCSGAAVYTLAVCCGRGGRMAAEEEEVGETLGLLHNVKHTHFYSHTRRGTKGPGSSRDQRLLFLS